MSLRRAIPALIIALMGGSFLFARYLHTKKTSPAKPSYQEEQIAEALKDQKYFERFLNLRRIQFVLPDVSRVDLVRLEDTNVWDSFFAGNYPPFQPSSIGSQPLTIEDNPELIRTLREAQDFSSAIPHPKQHKGYVLLCWAAHELDAAPHAYVYIPESGLLGRKEEWCHVPDKFAAWMKKQPHL